MFRGGQGIGTFSVLSDTGASLDTSLVIWAQTCGELNRSSTVFCTAVTHRFQFLKTQVQKPINK